MALSYVSQDLRLYVGGAPIHGLVERARTLRSMARTVEHRTHDRTSIGDPAMRYDYVNSRGGTLSVNGFYDDEHGLQPLMERATPKTSGGSTTGLPVTFSTQGARAESRSVIARSAQWTSENTTGAAGEPVMIDAEAQMSDFRSALFVYEGQATGGGSQGLGDLNLETQNIPVRQTSPVLELVNGAMAYLFQIPNTYFDSGALAVGDDIEFGPQVASPGMPDVAPSGIFRVSQANATSSGYTNVTVALTPPSSLAGIGPLLRNAVRTISVVDTFDGDRISLVHVSNLTRQDCSQLRVTIQGRVAGSPSWSTFGAGAQGSVTVPIPTGAGEDAAFTRAFYFDPGDGVRGIARARVLVEFLTPANAVGGRSDYSAYVRYDLAPRVVYH